MSGQVEKNRNSNGIFRILSLDGGGAKGFYTLGILHEIEALLQCPLYKRFDLVFGTSTGSIIAALIALGYSIDDIYQLYKRHVPEIMDLWLPSRKTQALKHLADEIFSDRTFTAFKVRVGIVTTKWQLETPMIFKSDVSQAHGRIQSFSPGFGCTISDAVQASCSAYPFFKRKFILTSGGDTVELADGGFCANNPTLYALADAVTALEQTRSTIRVVSLGVGVYPSPTPSIKKLPSLAKWLYTKLPSVRLLQKTLEVNTQSMEELRSVLFKDIATVRINDSFSQPEMATDFLESDLQKLDLLRQRGKASFAKYEAQLKEFLL